MKYLHNKKPQIPIITLKDVIEPDCIQHIANDLVMKFQCITKKTLVPLETLSIQDKRVLAVMADPELREDFKKNHKETYRKDVQKLKKINAMDGNRLYKEIEQLLREKCVELLNPRK